jgi:GNAT superfamily N-acetyltransferase
VSRVADGLTGEWSARRTAFHPRAHFRLQNMVSVRQAEPKDAEVAAEVLRRSITHLCTPDHQGDADTIAKWLANKTAKNLLSWLTNDDNFCVVADAKDEVLGVGLLHRSGEIRLCYLAPGAQGRGIGKAICLALEEKAKAWGLRKLSLESTISARPFYERLGYRSAGAAKPGFGISHCHPYEKALQPNPLMQPTAASGPRLIKKARTRWRQGSNSEN